MLNKQQAIDSEFWVLNSLLRDRGVLDLELEKHLERVRLLMRSFVQATPND